MVNKTRPDWWFNLRGWNSQAHEMWMVVPFFLERMVIFAPTLWNLSKVTYHIPLTPSTRELLTIWNQSLVLVCISELIVQVHENSRPFWPELVVVRVLDWTSEMAGVKFRIGLVSQTIVVHVNNHSQPGYSFSIIGGRKKRFSAPYHRCCLYFLLYNLWVERNNSFSLLFSAPQYTLLLDNLFIVGKCVFAISRHVPLAIDFIICNKLGI